MKHRADPRSEEQPVTPPLKRHAALQPLSREHMGGLVQARNVHAAATDPRTRKRAIADFLRIWHLEIRPHFDDEEHLLLPVIDDPRLRARLLGEHGTIRDLVALLQETNDATPDPDAMRKLSRLLHDHIRWEERELFEAIQQTQASALDQLLPAAALIETRRPGSRPRHKLDQPPTSSSD